MDIFSFTVLLRRLQPIVVGRGTKGRWEEKDAPLKSLGARNISKIVQYRTLSDV